MIRHGLVVRDDLPPRHNRERREHLADVPPPPLAKPHIPLHGPPQPLLKPRLLLPPQPAQLGRVDGVAVVVERPVVCVFYPAGDLSLASFFLFGLEVRGGGGGWRGRGGDGHFREEFFAEGQVADLVVRADVVDLAQLAAVEDRVEGVGCVAGVEVAPRGGAVAVEDDGLAPGEEAGEFGDDFCVGG